MLRNERDENKRQNWPNDESNRTQGDALHEQRTKNLRDTRSTRAQDRNGLSLLVNKESSNQAGEEQDESKGQQSNDRNWYSDDSCTIAKLIQRI